MPVETRFLISIPRRLRLSKLFSPRFHLRLSLGELLSASRFPGLYFIGNNTSGDASHRLICKSAPVPSIYTNVFRTFTARSTSLMGSRASQAICPLSTLINRFWNTARQEDGPLRRVGMSCSSKRSQTILKPSGTLSLVSRNPVNKVARELHK